MSKGTKTHFEKMHLDKSERDKELMKGDPFLSPAISTGHESSEHFVREKKNNLVIGHLATGCSLVKYLS